MFGKEFKVLKIPMDAIYQSIGKYEVFYAHEKNGILEYEILDKLFGQPSPANWDDSSYAKLIRSIASDELKRLVSEGIIEIIK